MNAATHDAPSRNGSTGHLPPIAIHGIGLIAPNILSFDDLRTADAANGAIVNETTNVPPPTGKTSRDLRRLARLTRLAAYAADQAAACAQLGHQPAGIYVGLTHGTAAYLKEFHDFLFDYGPEMASPNAFSNGVTNAPLGSISLHRKLTEGGVTLVGMETGGLEVLHHAATKLADGTHRQCLVGATEEYSPIVESVYHRVGWYRGGIPAKLPCPWDKQSETGFGVSEGSVFCVAAHPSAPAPGVASCRFTPIEELDTLPVAPDLIVSGAGGGPQDRFELAALEQVLTHAPSPIPTVFPKRFLGETFAVGSLFSVAVAWDILVNRADYQSSPLHDTIATRVTTRSDPHAIETVLVLSSNREGLTLGGLLQRSDSVT